MQYKIVIGDRVYTRGNEKLTRGTVNRYEVAWPDGSLEYFTAEDIRCGRLKKDEEEIR